MSQNKHIIIFSHGFGVKKDNRGLFTDITAALKNVESVMFDYNDIDEEKNQVTVKPFSKQVQILQAQLSKVKETDPNAIVDIICQSQGAVIVALAKPVGIRKIILLAPPASSGTERMVKTFQSRPGTEINMGDISRISRADGSTTIIPPEYWAERQDVEPLKLYEELAQLTELTIINANQDDVLDTVDFPDLKNVEIVNLDGDHGFQGEARKKLLEVITVKLCS